MKILRALMLYAAGILGLASAENFTQPVIWQDLADVDLIRVDNAFYYSASNMHFSPGAPILRSYDLVNWEYFSHSVPVLDFNGDKKFNLIGGNQYNQGTYASSLRLNKATGTFFWLGCIQPTSQTYIYTAPNIDGPWTQTSMIADECYYDSGLLFDDDGSVYVSFGKWIPDGNQAQIWVAQLTDDLQNKRIELAFHTTPDIGYIEGSRFYKLNSTYYIFLTNPGVGNGQIMLRSDTPFGPYEEWHRVLENNGNPVPFGSSPYQGALIDTQDGDWWYMAFVNLFPGGRFPVLAPVTWSDGWPNVDFVNGTNWSSTYPYPLPKHPVTPITGTDKFTTENLGPQYEWNHNPDNSKWSTGKGLALSTATVTEDFFMARNTLSHRILGPRSSATIELDYSAMKEGDKAGLATFLYDAAWIGISMTSSGATLQMVDNIIMSSTGGWHTGTTGDMLASKEVSTKGSIWLRVNADTTRDPAYSTFSYSTDGTNFSELGSRHHMDNAQLFFVGNRYGMFNYATKSLGGKVVVKSFNMSPTE